MAHDFRLTEESLVCYTFATRWAGKVATRMGSPRNRRFRGERRSSGMNEFSRLRGNERYGACDDDKQTAFPATGQTDGMGPHAWENGIRLPEKRRRSLRRRKGIPPVLRPPSPPQRRAPYPSRSTANSSFFGKLPSASRKICEIASFAKRLLFTVSQSASVTISALPPSKSNCSSPQSPSKSTR